jgi:hypothetical protein
MKGHVGEGIAKTSTGGKISHPVPPAAHTVNKPNNHRTLSDQDLAKEGAGLAGLS